MKLLNAITYTQCSKCWKLLPLKEKRLFMNIGILRQDMAFEFDEEEMNKEWEERMRKSDEIERGWEETMCKWGEIIEREEEKRREENKRRGESILSIECNEREEQVSDRYDEVRELDKRERYFMPASEIKPMKTVFASAPTANKSTRMRVKDINNGDLIEFPKMVEVARFLGTHVSFMRNGIRYGSAMVYRVGEKKYVIEYNGKERPLRIGHWCHEEGKRITAFHKNGWSREFFSYFEVARYFGLLVGEVIEDKKRRKARIHVINNEEFTLEFDGVKREIVTSWKVVCSKWGIYDRNYEGIEGIKVTRGNPQPRTEYEEGLR